VLPTTSALERDDIMINRRDTALVYMSAAIDPVAQARDDYDIFADLSRRMGTQRAFTEGRTSQNWQEMLWDECSGVAQENGFDLPPLSDFREAGIFDIPNTPTERVQLQGVAPTVGMAR